MDKEEIREKVREQYSQAALRVTGGGCCGTDDGCCATSANTSAVTSDLYTREEAAQLPIEAVLASLGCGNPTALARLNPGETVLDLGSGGGIDVLLSARRVGPTGFAYGLDMTDEMLALAEKNRLEAGVDNVKFLKGYIENIPLPDNSVDVIISNCVINLAADKRPVLQEAFRVLKPGGRFAVSDVVVQGEAPEDIIKSLEMWTGCIAGALHEDEYKGLLAEAGFTDIGIEITRRYTAEDIGAGCNCDDGCCGTTAVSLNGAELEKANGVFVSAFVRAVKPRG
jgi:SAM-dependent methyltransferase